MSNYLRYRVVGGTYFFKLNLLQRPANDLLVGHIESFRDAVKQPPKRWLFHIDAGGSVTKPHSLRLDFATRKPRQCEKHLIVDDADYAAHVDYYHINSLKHGSVKQVADRVQ